MISCINTIEVRIFFKLFSQKKILGNKSEPKEKGKVDKHKKSKDYEKHGLFGTKIKREKKWWRRWLRCPARHQTPWRAAAGHPNAGHGLAHEADIIGRWVHQPRLQETNAIRIEYKYLSCFFWRKNEIILFSETDLGQGDVEVQFAGEDAIAAEYLSWGGRRQRGGHLPPAGAGEGAGGAVEGSNDRGMRVTAAASHGREEQWLRWVPGSRKETWCRKEADLDEQPTTKEEAVSEQQGKKKRKGDLDPKKKWLPNKEQQWKRKKARENADLDEHGERTTSTWWERLRRTLGKWRAVESEDGRRFASHWCGGEQDPRNCEHRCKAWGPPVGAVLCSALLPLDPRHDEPISRRWFLFIGTVVAFLPWNAGPDGRKKSTDVALSILQKCSAF
jgi:hypothetical protein